MDIDKLIRTKGFETVPNPNYNSRSKKNNEPSTIQVQNLNNVKDAAIDMAIVDFRNQYSISSKEANKYRKKGINYNPYENLDLSLAQSQSALTKWGNAFAQTFVSEIGLGTVKAFSDLVDLVGMAFGYNDGDYSNPVSAFLEEKQEEFKAFAPVYADPNKHLSNGGLLDAGWWGSNLPSIASSLTLLLPAMTLTKGVKAIGSAINLGARTRRTLTAFKKAGQRAKAARYEKLGGAMESTAKFLSKSNVRTNIGLALENGASAVMMRATENYQESRQTYNDMYVQAFDVLRKMDDESYSQFLEANPEIADGSRVNPNDKDAVAKYIATKSADETFKIDWLNLGWDVLQMYGLRNAWKGLRNSHETPAVVRRRNIDEAKYFGKSKDEIAQLKKARPFSEKAKEWFEDKAYASKLVIGAEASEGAEEALNYIAQQEGMHLGGVMLGTVDGKHDDSLWHNFFSGYDGRLKEYLQAPDLWDSAFWGVLGGVVFQSVGSGMQRVANTIINKNDKETEDARKNLPWYHLDELPQVKGQISEIESRGILYNEYLNKLNKINNDNVDVYNSTEDNEVKFETEEEKAVARQRLANEFRQQLALNASRKGTFNLLRAFVADDNVRKNMIASGLFNATDINGNHITKSEDEIEQESKEYIEDTLKTIDEVDEMYLDEIGYLNDIVTDLENDNKKTDNSEGFIPVEYIQLAAINNVNARFTSKLLDTSINFLENNTNDIHDKLLSAGKLDAAIPYRNNIKVSVAIARLGRLRADRKKLLQSDKDKLSNQIAIRNIDEEIASIEENFAHHELVYATFVSLQFGYDANGKLIQTPNEESTAYYDSLILQHNPSRSGLINIDKVEPFVTNEKAFTSLDDSEKGAFDVLAQNNKITIENLRKISPELERQYISLARLEYAKDNNNKSILRSIDDLNEKFNEYHNTLNQARKRAIDQSNEIILDLYNKYHDNADDIIEAIKVKALGRSEQEFNNYLTNLTDEEKRKLSDALDVLELTKNHNYDLYYSLRMALHDEDLKIAGTLVENPTAAPSTNNNQNNQPNIPNSNQNSSQNNGSQSTQNSNPNNNTSSNQNAPQSPQNGSQGQNSQQPNQPSSTQPNQPQQRKEVRSFHQSAGAINNLSNPNNNTLLARFIEYDDDTYELDVQNDPRGMQDDTLFEGASSFDLTRSVEVVERPILEKNSNGSYTVIQKGKLKYKLDGTPTQPISSTGGLNQQPQGTQATTPTNDVDVPIFDDGSNQASDDSLGSYQNASLDLGIDITNSLRSKIREIGYETINLDEVGEQIRQEYISNGNRVEDVDKELEISKRSLQLLIDRKKAQNANKMQSSVDEVILNEHYLADTNDLNAVNAFKNAINGMLNQYAKELNLNKINGKYYISLEDLLRFVNQQMSDNMFAKMLYNNLLYYLDSDEAKEKYVLIDSEEAFKQDFLANVEKSEELRRKERTENIDSFRIDISSWVSIEKQSEFDNIFNNLNVGDKVTYKVLQSAIAFYDKDGNKIGQVPIPFIDKTTGAYLVTNDGWNYDITTNNGQIVSRLKDLFTNWFISNEADIVELRNILMELSFTKPSVERRLELRKQFENNAAYKKAFENGFVRDDVEIGQVINGLVKLVRFARIDSNSSDRVKQVLIAKSIDDWFEKLYNSYSNIRNLSTDNGSTELSIAKINDGEIVRIVDNNPIEAEKQAKPINEALVGGSNPNIQHIAIADKINVGVLNTAGLSNMTFSGVTAGNTFVVIPKRNGSYDYVHAYPANVSADYISKEAKEIIEAISNRAKNLLFAFGNTPSNDNFNALKDFLISTFSSANGNSSLFQGVVVTFDNQKQSINIGVSRNNKYGNNVNRITIFKTTRNNRFATNAYVNGKSMPISSKDSLTKLEEIIKSAIFNINYNYIKSDNNANMNLNGLAKKENGKFVIEVGDKRFEFNSYNEFIINNNLVRLNTEPNKEGTSNFNRIGRRSQAANRSLELEFGSGISTPVEERVDNVSSPTTTEVPVIRDKSINEQIDEVLNDSKYDKDRAFELVKILISEDAANALKVLNILPKTLVFDANDEDVKENNAKFVKSTGITTIGAKWLNLASNPQTRNRAARILVHEAIHQELSKYKNKYYIESIKEVYNEFKEALDNEGIAEDASIRKFLFKSLDEETALEEFIVESLTNIELINKLNNIKAKDYKKGKISNLLQKLLQALAKIFGWNINKGSLYEKELYTLRLGRPSNKKNNKENKENKQTKKDKKGKKTKIDNTPQIPGLFDDIVDDDTNVEDNQNITDVTPTNENIIDDNQEEQIAEEVEEEKPILDEDDDIEDISDEFTSNDEDDEDEAFSSVDENVYTEEMNRIKEEAISNGNFMKASNGNPTNLNEKQWLQVRTKSFINWFGDWINNPSEASKVVDENGEPLVTYHTGNSDIGTFNDEEAIVIEKYKESFTNKKLEDYIKEGYIITEEDIENYNNYRPIKIIKPNAIYTTDNLDMSSSYRPEERELYALEDEYIDSNIEHWQEEYANAIEGLYYHFLDYFRTPKEERYKKILKDDKADEYYSLTKDMDIFSINDNDYKEFFNIVSKFEKVEEFIKNHNIDIENIDYEDLKHYADEFSYEYAPAKKDREDYHIYDGTSTDIVGGQYHLFVNIKNPLIVDAKGNVWNNIKFEGSLVTTRDLEKIGRERGNDGVIIYNVLDYGPNIHIINLTSGIVIEAYKPNQVKDAVDNNGDFFNENDDIRFSSVDEEVVINAPSVESMKHRLPVSDRAIFTSLVASAELSTSCK